MVGRTVAGLDLTAVAAALVLGQEPPVEAVARLRAEGCARLDVWRRLATGWVELAGPEEVAEELLPAIWAHALAAPDPDAAALGLSRLLAERPGLTLPREIAGDPRFGGDLLYLLGFGCVPADALIREPGLSDLLSEPERLRVEVDAETLTAEVYALTDRLTEPELRRNALRRWKRGQLLRVIARDVLLQRPQREITREISAVADACLRAALRAAARAAGIEPEPAGHLSGLAVIGMGKWGSRELNYNSDIDLLCVFVPGGGRGGEVWETVVLEMARELDQQTAEGRVFRVDFRLRPEGSAGSVVRSLESCVAYYQTRSEAWEAQALTKARFVGGDPAIGRAFEELARQVAYGTRMSRAGVAMIRRNRRRLDERSDAERNVKEGRGGIRDIEFTVQLLQLVRGVTDPAVRAPNTWEALEALRVAGAISEVERRTLHEAYDFLRRVEHLLQIQPVTATRELPEDRAAMRRLARGMGYRDAGPLSAAGRFLEAYRSHTSAAHQLCRRLFFNPIPLGAPDSDEAICELLDPLLGDDEAARHLAEIRFANPTEARRRLLFLAHGEPPMRLPEEIQTLFVEFLPALLACVQRMPEPDQALYWFERFIARAGGRELIYRFLNQHPPVIELLCRIGGFSAALSQTIVDHPEYLDRIINPDFVRLRPTAGDLADELAQRLRPLRSPELRLDDIRRFRRREQFRIGVLDLLGEFDTEQVTGALTDLADICLAATLAACRELVPEATELPFAIVGGGKLGGRELHYSSDLDVLFVFDSPEPAALQTAEALARRLLQVSGERTRAGTLFALDARLRPYGANSQLSRSLAGYVQYWTTTGAVWERLAMTRTRAVAGDPELGQRFVAAAREFACRGPLTADELAEVRRIKHRIETERRKLADGRHLDLKVEPGGILEIEFLAQLLQVQHGGPTEPPEANTVAALEALAARDYLSADEALALVRCYRRYRFLETRLQLTLERSSGLLPLDEAGLTAAARRLGWSATEAEQRPDQLLADLRERLRCVKEIYDRRVGRWTG